nr:MAG TPA: hypothetical protein [Caudoviricetes sp.]
MFYYSTRRRPRLLTFGINCKNIFGKIDHGGVL